jgi:hypothetical protein
MSTFEFVFSLFGLLLGFTLVEVLAGIVRTTRREGLATRHLYLTTALGVFVALDLITYWMVLWAARDVLPVSTLALYVGFLISGVYYWAASMIFPDAADQQPDLDAHYFRVRRKVVGAVIFCNLAMAASIITAMGRLPPIAGMVEFAVIFVLFAALLLVRSKAASAVLLTLVILDYIGWAIWRSLGA